MSAPIACRRRPRAPLVPARWRVAHAVGRVRRTLGGVPRSILLVYAHPYPQRSRAGRALVDAVKGLPYVSLRVLYTAYPDFAIDVEREQAALVGADLVVWQ